MTIIYLYLLRVHEIAYGFVVLKEKNVNYFLLQNTNLVSAQILLVMSDRTDKFHASC